MMKVKRTKKYNPRNHRINIFSVEDTIRLSAPVPQDSADRLNTQILSAFESISKGNGNLAHFYVLESTVDLVFDMAKNIFQNAYADDIYQARQALSRLKDKFNNTGKFIFDGEGYGAYKQLISIHDVLIENVTGAEVMKIMRAREKNIKSDKFYRSDIERLAA